MDPHQEEILYTISLTLVPQIGSIQARILLDQFGSAKEVFRTKKHVLEKIGGIGHVRADNICNFKLHQRAEKELKFIEANGIQALLYHTKTYPTRLKNCEDPPPILFYKGNADLHTEKILSIVGTRRSTEQGREIIQAYLEAWKGTDILIVSGLAYGIDYTAHNESLRNGLKTVGVLAHGLDKIYPSAHLPLARQMKEQGGLLTEFISGTQPDKQNFPRRNRIVAGLCDALLVIETDIKGGSMITAELASGYNREVFAIPGRIHDEKSQGCNFLIRENKARLTMHPSDIPEFMNWNISEPSPVVDKVLFADLDPDQQVLVEALKQTGIAHIDQLQALSGLPHSRFSSALLYLEMERVVVQVPGKQFKLNNRHHGQNLLRI